MKMKLKFEKLSDVNIQYGSCDIVFFHTYRETRCYHSFRFHSDNTIYNYSHRYFSVDITEQLCRRLHKTYRHDNGF